MTENVKILLVEDNEKLANYIKTCLQECGYTVSHIANGGKAIYRIIKEQPDVVLLDIMLPELNGQQICQSVRPDYLGKIIMLTALADMDTEVGSLNCGADDYIAKPFKTDILKARIAAVLRRPPLANSKKLITHGQLTVDTTKHEVYLRNQLIPINPSEYNLLVLLTKNADTVLSRDAISYALYGREYDGVDRGIDHKISALRKKLGDDPKHAFRIKTIHGKGYVFISSAWE